MRPLLVGPVGIELLGDGLAHELQRHAPGFGLDGLEVIEPAIVDQGRGFGREFAADIGLERRDVVFFLAALNHPKNLHFVHIPQSRRAPLANARAMLKAYRDIAAGRR